MLRVSRLNTEITELTVINVDPKLPNVDNAQLYQAQNVRGQPISRKNPDMDVLCYPALYPRGRGGMYQERAQKIGASEFIKHVFDCADPRFRLDKQFLFSELDR